MSAVAIRLQLLMRSVRCRSEYVNRQVKTEPPSEKRAVFLIASKKCKALTDFPFKKRLGSQYLSSKRGRGLHSVVPLPSYLQKGLRFPSVVVPS